MVLVGLSRIKWWMTGALIVALTSLAYAKPSFVSHEGHGLFGGASSFHGSSFGGPVHGNTVPRANISRDMPRGVAMSGHAGRYARNEAPRTRGNASGRTSVNDTFAGRVYGSNASNYTAQRMALPADVYRNRPAAQYVGTQYAGAITPISTDSHNAPRPPATAQSAHVGSIRDDVTRYNEERGASRPIPRPPGDPSRIPSPSPYRN
ncbi:MULTISPECIES: hypothetical protein [Paraburkholderia]|jgi:hypothetical protein|uniref:Peptide-binding protein n=2 Tax=Paraburkholderia hospita TaxID=169430 RepID=A0AAJ4VM37_9BURK|nr:hypothetical protein [Paraburkholderia hospita]EUC21428.1 hypothetical protein PMI06_009144 [Burkholderia sp. BT03]SKC67402.1 hypothetical protein SAMN05445504_0652 [Burkholderia sp. CF099]AUT67079.1 hypothetical protein C2L64_01025 [Paraburkholderia hospita]AXE97172.1 hypothetical protein CUJ88_00795 [Paraburkholderia hospita]OUL73986.1 hypothetical protein CA603_42585 [Paraburkholderia hospita]